MPKKPTQEPRDKATYNLPVEIGYALTTGRPELLQPMIRRLTEKPNDHEWDNKTNVELLRLVGDLMRDIDFERRKYNHLVSEIEEALLPGATELKTMAMGLENISGLLEKDEKGWKALLGA